MQYIDSIQESLDYIEMNLKAEIKVEELANAAGYSLFHYYRIFQNLVGMPVMQYITRRKLLYSAFEISKGSKVIDTALSYGFDTNAGFYKAFMREFGKSPLDYIKHHTIKQPYKIKLIQEEHIMITQNKIREMLFHWNLQNEKLSDFYYIGTGNRADNVWNVGEKYIIKIGTNVKGLENHIKISKALSELGFDTSIPVESCDGKEYILDGELYYYIANKLSGKPIKSIDIYGEEHNYIARYIGEIVGQLDLVLARFDNDIVCNETNILNDMLNWAIPKVKQVSNLSDSFYDDYLNNFSVLYPHLPKQIIHRDINPSNIIMQDGKVSGFIDFELTEKNIRIFDPCYTATAILSETFTNEKIDKKKWLAIFESIVTGYDSVVKLSKQEKEAIPYVIFSIQFICIAYFSGFEKYKELTKINRDMLNWFIENKEKLIV
ncbi:helix-turn-helix domain-containing protein [Paludicola sp. MB14-C6]|uniref:helix-turn-helix domain-containing protein n=1 Tax=Paludihabitans sp. MB14-C6 TaxID=3070656 RepID=UPI0027DCE5B4|nr:helix-turn-helix domain-containing protein [Paludicola sp. MB14-C6]WMJ22518.1 helix-turn-helix domain-containing protein [Paludicola sp. MB14-C6]